MEEKKERRKFTRELLDECLQRDGATLIGEYEKLSSRTMITFKCKCEIEVHKRFKIIVNSAGAFCQKDTFILSKQKAGQTNIEKYGVDNPFKLKDFQDKMNEIKIQKYGTQYPTQNKEVLNKIKETNLQRYGVENPTMNKEIYERVKETTMKHYGVDCSLKSNIIKNKVNETNMKKYGGIRASHSKEIYKKIKETNMKKYGTDYPIQNINIQEKLQTNSKKFKDYTMPSGTIRKVQGYEPFALDILLKEYTEEQILTDRKEVGRIPYKHGEKQRYYFPDIKIPHMNKIIEVKSQWTLKLGKDLIDLKANAAKDAGFDYEIWVINKKGVCQEIIK